MSKSFTLYQLTGTTSGWSETIRKLASPQSARWEEGMKRKFKDIVMDALSFLVDDYGYTYPPAEARFSSKQRFLFTTKNDNQ